MTIYATSISNTSNVSDALVSVSLVADTPFDPITRPTNAIPKSLVHKKAFAFRDIANKGLPHPLTGDITTAADFAAVGQSIKNIIRTNPYERFMDDIEFGVGIDKYQFAILSPDILSQIKENIVTEIARYEPRAILHSVNVDSDTSQHQMEIQIEYGIRTSNSTDSVIIIVERT